MNCVHCATPVPEGALSCPACGADSGNPAGGDARDPGSLSKLGDRLRAAVGDRYEVTKLLGQGGMGAVYLATERKLDRPVAIKVLPPDLSYNEKLLRRFQREARTAAKLDHPHIIPIYSVEDEDDLHYFVMKYVAGHNLATELDAGPMPVERAQRILWESASALEHAHQCGVVHRDVKPGNIMIDANDRAMLTDFGISKALEASTQFTATGQVIGTPFFMSPEQAKGQTVDGRADQYALATVGYRMLTGRLPFGDESVHTVMYKQIFEKPTPVRELRREVPASLADALERAMAKDANERFGSMAEFAAAIWPENPQSIQGQSGGHQRQSGAARITSSAKIRRAVFATAAAGLVAAGVWFVTRVTGAEPAESGAASGTVPSEEAPAPTDRATGDSVVATTAIVDSGPPTEEQSAQVRAQPSARQEERAPPSTPRREAAAVGYLTVSADPWGTVYIDGTEIRDTPIARHELPPGRYVVEVQREGYQTYVDTVLVTAGNVTRRTYVLQRPPP